MHSKKLSCLLILLFFVASVCFAQKNTIAQFAIWKPKPGQKTAFENGYKQHLQWHKSNKDKWDWYGWYFSTGYRTGQFIDATNGHTWKDFDNAVKPAEDRADNDLHVYPFADLETVFRLAFLPELSIYDSNSLKSKFLRLVTLDVSNIQDGVKVLEKLKTSYLSLGINNLMNFKMIDGGNINQLIILLGSNSREEFGKTENLQQEISSIETSLKLKVIASVTSETLTYLPAMSLFAE